MYSLALIIFVVSEKNAFEHFPIGINVNLCPAVDIIKAKLYMNVHWMVLYKLYVFYSDMKFKMAATAGLSLTLDPMGKMFQNASSLKPLGWFNQYNSFREEYISVFSPYGPVLIL
jgi:hypothetical protein